jgi:hypothetical protein
MRDYNLLKRLLCRFCFKNIVPRDSQPIHLPKRKVSGPESLAGGRLLDNGPDRRYATRAFCVLALLADSRGEAEPRKRSLCAKRKSRDC